MIDITPIVNAVIALAAVIVTVILIPYIRSRTTASQQAIIAAVVQTAVYGFEQIVTGSGMGEEKFEKAMEYIESELAKRKISIDYEEIKMKLEETVKQLKIEQGG